MISKAKPIPGYGGSYLIAPDGTVYNKLGKPLKASPSKQGPCVDLRYRGQRDRVLISELLRKMEEPNEGIGAD